MGWDLRGRAAGAISAWLAISAGLAMSVGCTSDSGNDSPSSTALATPSISRSAPGPLSSSSAAPARPADWPTYGGDLQRSGFSASMPAASGRLTARQIPLDGQVYASPIVVGGRVIVATEHNSVYALSSTGAQLWRTILGAPTPRSALPCGNIDPLGITGTPVWDAASRSVFVVTSTGTTVRHDLIALDPDTGRVRWRHSVDLPGTDPQAMQQRGALTVVDGKVWVPFGGLAGDCGAYKGRVVGVPVGGLAAGTQPVAYTVPTTREAGIWAPPGPTVFQGRLFVAVGNGESVGRTYDYSDSVLELDGTRLVSSFSPRTWASDNRSDLDLGSQGPAIVSGKWVFIAGKSETAYVLRAADLGGIGAEVSSKRLCASFGGTAVVGDTVYVPCSDGIRAVRISNAGVLTERWHAAQSIAGSPVVGGGRVYALDQDAGVLHALDPASGKAREQVAVGQTSRFAVPAISGGRLFVPTLAGLTIVDSVG
jgi:outer membrane protein assembly factor BamB